MAFISSSLSSLLFLPLYDCFKSIKSTRLLQRFSGKIGNSFHSPSSCHFVAPQGLSSCVEHFLPEKSTYFNRRVQDLTIKIFEDGGNDNNTAKWKATADDGTVGLFNAVIVTQPLPQLMNGDISGDIMSLLNENRAEYLSVGAFSSRYAVAIYYPEECQQLLEKIPWTVNYVDGHDCIRYVSLESRKLGKSGCPAVVLHSTVPYGIGNIDRDNSEVEAEMVSYAGYNIGPHTILSCLLVFFSFFCIDLTVTRNPNPNYVLIVAGTVLGEIQLGKPLCTKLVQWRYSQCRTPVSGAPGAVLLNRSPPLVVAGDAFTGSNFDGCVASAEAATDAVMDALTLLKPLSSSH